MAGIEAKSAEAATGVRTRVATNNLEAYWMPFTANRQFKQAPRMLVAAEGMYYRTAEGKKVLDGTAGLWCCNAGHARPKIVEAVARQVKELDYAPVLPDGPSEVVRARLPPRHLHAAGHRPCVLHQFRVGIGRDGAEDRHRLPARPAARARASA